MAGYHRPIARPLLAVIQCENLARGPLQHLSPKDLNNLSLAGRSLMNAIYAYRYHKIAGRDVLSIPKGVCQHVRLLDSVEGEDGHAPSTIPRTLPNLRNAQFTVWTSGYVVRVMKIIPSGALMHTLTMICGPGVERDALLQFFQYISANVADLSCVCLVGSGFTSSQRDDNAIVSPMAEIISLVAARFQDTLVEITAAPLAASLAGLDLLSSRFTKLDLSNRPAGWIAVSNEEDEFVVLSASRYLKSVGLPGFGVTNHVVWALGELLGLRKLLVNSVDADDVAPGGALPYDGRIQSLEELMLEVSHANHIPTFCRRLCGENLVKLEITILEETFGLGCFTRSLFASCGQSVQSFALILSGVNDFTMPFSVLQSLLGCKQLRSISIDAQNASDAETMRIVDQPENLRTKQDFGKEMQRAWTQLQRLSVYPLPDALSRTSDGRMLRDSIEENLIEGLRCLAKSPRDEVQAEEKRIRPLS